MVSGGVGFAAEHPGNFLDSGVAFHLLESGEGAVLGEFLGNDELFGGEGRDLGEVADAEDLMSGRDLPHFGANGLSDFATDVGIDFVENEEGDGVLGGERGFDGEHDPGDFAAGGDGAQRFCGFAGVGGEEEIHGFKAVGAGFGEGQEGDGESGVFESEVAKVCEDVFCEFRGGFGTFGGELSANVSELLSGGLDFAGDAFEFGRPGVEFGEAGGGLLAESEDGVDGAAVLAFQGFDLGDAVFEFPELIRVNFELIGVMAEAGNEVFEGGNGLEVGLGEGSGVGVEAFEIAEEASGFVESGEEGVIGFGEPAEEGMAEVEEAPAVGDELIACEQAGFLV
ncbi:MAG: hypothetical protein RLZZ253_1622 [Verrucomicrobiota bacterium]